MDFELSSEIHYYDMQTAAVQVMTNASDDDRQFADQLNYCCLALRQLVNMKGDRFAERLIQFLVSVANHPFQTIEGGDIPFALVDYLGKPAKKHFTTSLIFKNQIPEFKLTTKGLGVFEKNLRFYATASVMILYYYLTGEYQEDRNFLSAIAKIGSLCASVYYSGQLTVMNQTPGALQIVREANGELE